MLDNNNESNNDVHEQNKIEVLNDSKEDEKSNDNSDYKD